VVGYSLLRCTGYQLFTFYFLLFSLGFASLSRSEFLLELGLLFGYSTRIATLGSIRVPETQIELGVHIATIKPKKKNGPKQNRTNTPANSQPKKDTKMNVRATIIMP
jgi:hypothetical protein